MLTHVGLRDAGCSYHSVRWPVGGQVEGMCYGHWVHKPDSLETDARLIQIYLYGWVAVEPKLDV